MDPTGRAPFRSGRPASDTPQRPTKHRVRIAPEDARAQDRVPPDLRAQAPEITPTDLLEHLRAACAESVRDLVVQNLVSVFLHLPEIDPGGWNLDVRHALTLLTCVSTAEVGNDRDEMRAEAMRHEVVHESEERVDLKVSRRVPAGEMPLEDGTPNTIVPLGQNEPCSEPEG